MRSFFKVGEWAYQHLVSDILKKHILFFSFAKDTHEDQAKQRLKLHAQDLKQYLLQGGDILSSDISAAF